MPLSICVEHNNYSGRFTRHTSDCINIKGLSSWHAIYLSLELYKLS